MHTGHCLCGAIAFRISGELPAIQVCHCTQCRRANGAPFATNIPIERSAFTLERGAEWVQEFESSPGKKRAFCRRCGSPVYSRRDASPDALRLRAGLLDEPVAARPALHFHAASKVSWWEIADGLPQFPGESGPPRKP